MIKPKVLARLLTALMASIVLAGCSMVPIRESDLPPVCEWPICGQVAESGDHWLRSRHPSGEPFYFAGVSMKLPAGYQLEHTSDGELLVWPDGRAIRLKEITATDLSFPALPNPFLNSHYTLADYPRLMFLHQATEPEPTTLNDRYIWRMAMDNKGTYFGESRHLYYSQWHGLQLYFAGVWLMELRQLAFIVDPRYPDRIIQLLCYNTPVDFLLDRLASIRTF